MLIIGILAAVALPQYTLAVEKTRAGSALSMLRSVADSLDRYDMENGGNWSKWPTSTAVWEQLDIQVPHADAGCPTVVRNGKADSHFIYQIATGSPPGWTRVYRGKCSGSKLYDRHYDLFYYRTVSTWGPKNTIVCEQFNTLGGKVCKSLGGVYKNSNKYIIPY